MQRLANLRTVLSDFQTIGIIFIVAITKVTLSKVRRSKSSFVASLEISIDEMPVRLVINA